MKEEDVLLSGPGYTVCDFLLVIQPHEALWQTIMDEKVLFAKTYKCPMALNLKPHIALARFKQYDMMQQRIINSLKNIAANMQAFKVELKDFGSFPTHTIYLNITSKVAVMDAVKNIRQAQKLMKLDKDNKPHFITEPHIAIARKLMPWQYEKAWLEYEQKHFHGRFIADSMLLLKRKEGKGAYQIIQRFELHATQPVAITQGSLFSS
jgi:2'-5' RNA ligase